MAPERLKGHVSYPLLALGILLTISGLLPLISMLAMLGGLVERQETMQPWAVLLNSVFFLVTGLSALMAFFKRRQASSLRWARIAGSLLLLFALAFPFAVGLDLPFLIPLLLYLCGATGIWALLRSR